MPVVLLLAGPATAALYYYVAQIQQLESVGFRTFLHGFRTFFVRGYLLALVDFALFGLLTLNVWFYLAADVPQLARPLSVIFLWAVVIWFVIQPYLFPMIVELDITIWQAFRNALLLALDTVSTTLGLLLIHIFMVIVLAPFVLLVYPLILGTILAGTHTEVVRQLLDKYRSRSKATTERNN